MLVSVIIFYIIIHKKYAIFICYFVRKQIWIYCVYCDKDDSIIYNIHNLLWYILLLKKLEIIDRQLHVKYDAYNLYVHVSYYLIIKKKLLTLYIYICNFVCIVVNMHATKHEALSPNNSTKICYQHDNFDRNSSSFPLKIASTARPTSLSTSKWHLRFLVLASR